MSKCHNRYDASTSKDDCSPTPSVNHLLRASAIVATGVFLAITVVLLICILHKRRMIFFGRLRNGPRRVQNTPALYIWSAPGATPNSEPPQTDHQAAVVTHPTRGKFSKGALAAAALEPVSCVIMAGEERPTHLARPLPRDEFVDESLDPKLDELERGKRKATLNSSVRGNPR